MDHLARAPTPLFGEPAYDTVANDGGVPEESPSSSGASELTVSELMTRYPLSAVTAAGAVALLAVMAVRKNSVSRGDPQKQLTRYARFMEKAARREYRRSDIGNQIATMASSPEVSRFITQALEQLQAAVAAKKR